MQRVDVTHLHDRDYAAVVTEGEDTTHHRVNVDPDLADDLGLFNAEEADVVREGVLFLLDRVPAAGLSVARRQRPARRTCRSCRGAGPAAA